VPDASGELERGSLVPGATSHAGYREWAIEALGDERQVYAHSTTSGPAAPLVFLPPGAAAEFREAARRGELVCPVPGCPSPALTTRGPRSRRHHFVHLEAPPGAEHQRVYVRHVATELIVEWVHSAHPKSTVETDATVAGIDIAVLVTGPHGKRFAVMFVDHRLGADGWWDTDYKLRRASLVRGWIFASRQFLRYPQPSPDARPGDPAVIDRDRGDIVLDRPVFRAMRAEGQWPLVLSIDRREVANLVVPDGAVARRLELRRPASRERVLHLVLSALADCRLGLHGIETPAVGASVLAAPSVARERREREAHALPAVGANVLAAPIVARERQEREAHAPQSYIATGRQASPLATPSWEDRVRAALDSGGPVTSVAALVTQLELDGQAAEKRLREVLYFLRFSGVIDFERPLNRTTAIRVRSASA